MKIRHIGDIAVFILITMLLLSVCAGVEYKQPLSFEETSPVMITKTDLQRLVVLENNVARRKQDIGETEVDKNPDYTTMFPDLYTESMAYQDDKKEERIAYLTFDDGPSKNTFKVLDILEEQDIKATFFIVGSAIDKNGEICLKRMSNEGHTIGIHTYSHMCNEIYCSVERFLDDFNMVYQQVYEITGERVNIYRFPWGSNNNYSKNIKNALLEEMERRGFTCYDWNVDSKDSVGRPSSYKILSSIKKDLKRQEQPIILMHDSKINSLTIKLLPDIIKMLQELGYEFDTLDHRKPYQFPW